MEVQQLVTRKSHHHDILFRITNINQGIAFLKGEVIRLIADAPIADLEACPESDSKLILPRLKPSMYARSSLVQGLILHLDGDEYYLKKAMAAYREYGVPAIGYFVRESELPQKLPSLLLQHQPDILILTGHDAFDGTSREDLRAYRNSAYFAEAVKKARAYQSNKDSLVIIAGACQSNYEVLLRSGANFASSPTRENIHLLDPVLIATQLAKTPVSEYAPIAEILQSTISHRLGGIDTRGVARRVFLGGSKT